MKCAKQTQLRYMCIGGYAVNYYGYHRYTQDMDIWIAPTNENKEAFINTLQCMGYSQTDTAIIGDEDFTKHFKCSLGELPDIIDVLTFIHHDIHYDQAEKKIEFFKMDESTVIPVIPYEFLKEAKIRSGRSKDLEDIAKLELIRNQRKSPE
ncbi:MAG: hypothetical protein ABIR66_08540 [Saprospiraceae bacterium]